MAVSPTGSVTLCKVPWNSNYVHVCKDVMGNPSAIAGTWGVSTTHNYTYIREGGNIKVPYNADDIYGVNYVVYDHQGKAFCCFVNNIEYINNNTSLLELQEDVWQTWGGNIEWHSCFVAREHVNSDQIGEHIVAEPDMFFNYETIDEYSMGIDSRVIIVMTNAIPKLRDGSDTIFSSHNKDDFDGSEPVSGAIYNGVYHGAKAYGFINQPLPLKNFLNNLQLCGAGESICCCFMIPATNVSISDNHEVIAFAGEYTQTSQFNFSHSCGGGYEPRNKKLLTYPYTYMNIVDHNGTSLDLMFERFGGAGTFSNRSNLTFQLAWHLDPTASMVLRPLSYKDGTATYTTKTNCAVQCSWSYGSYNNWLAQNADKQGTNYLVGAALLAGGIIGSIAGGILVATGVGAGAGAFAITAGLGSAAAGVTKLMGTEQENSVHSKIPDTTTTMATTNSLYALGLNYFGIRNVGIRADHAKSIDAFFDQFGYEVDVIKVPNITGRPNWNYVKTVGANVGGDIPSDKLAIINQCLDNGITFWHTTDVGNYGLNNEL